MIRLDEHNVGASRLGRGRDFLSVISIFRNKTINYVENCFVFFVVVVVDGGVVGVPPFSLFSHLVVVLVSGMTVSRRLGRRRHARAFSHSLLFSLFSFCFLVGYFTFYLQAVILGDLLSCMMTAVCCIYNYTSLFFFFL